MGELGRTGARFAIAAWLALVALGCGKRAEREPPAPVELRVAAASDLTLAFDELGKQFSAKTGERVSFTYGSTGLLAKQIAQGAPFDLFAAANVSFVNEVVAQGACDGASAAPYARGRIAMWSRSGMAPPAHLRELVDARYTRIAIANPEHAPYGKAAQQALETVGVWDRVKDRIVYGENVKQTLQYARSGNAELAIVALSLVLGSSESTWVEIPEALHAPIGQALVVCRHGARADAARAFAAYLGSAEGRATMRRYGFLLPGETLVRHP